MAIADADAVARGMGCGCTHTLAGLDVQNLTHIGYLLESGQLGARAVVVLLLF